MSKLILLVCFLLASIPGFSQHDSTRYLPIESRLFFNWGNDSTAIRISRYGNNQKLVMIHLHDDESTSVRAARQVLGETGGILIEVENKGVRLVKFRKSGKIFWFDPNRIFTAKGRLQNLRFLNRNVTSSAISLLKAFALFIVRQIPPDAMLIALHNNVNLKYSINSYKPYHNRAHDVLKLYISSKKDPDNFFLVTKTRLYQAIRKLGFNVVLQYNYKARDDGSLSIVYGRPNRPYANVEAEHGSLSEQVAMLQALISIL
jgi:hypothetical protein